MFRKETAQGRLSILYSCGGAPLKIWGTHVQNGCVRRITDPEINSLALEVAGNNVSTTYIYAPKDAKKSLGIQFPFMVMILKNMRRYFTFTITVLDDRHMSRRFRMSNFLKYIKRKPLSTAMPLCLGCGWVQIQLNLGDLVRRAYGSNYVETSKVQINANCRIRQIYFADRLYNPDELPDEFKLFLPPPKGIRVDKKSKDRTSETSKDKLSISQVPLFSTFQEEFAGEISLDSSLAAEEFQKLNIHVPSANFEERDDQSALSEHEPTPESDKEFNDKEVNNEKFNNIEFNVKELSEKMEKEKDVNPEFQYSAETLNIEEYVQSY